MDSRIDHQPVALAAVNHPDETAVDLDFCRRNFLEIIQRREAGSIVIDRDVDAHRPQLGEHFNRSFVAGHRRRFRDFECEVVGSHPVFRQQGLDPVQQVRAIKQPGRQVYSDIHVIVADADVGSGLDGAFKDKGGQFVDAVALFGSWDEVSRSDFALLGMRPADQSLGPDDPFAAEIDFRLVGNP